MPIVQVLLPDNRYSQLLKALLASEGGYKIEHLAAPDFTRFDDIIVADRPAVERFPRLLDNPGQLVLITANDPHFLATLWEHGVRSVVFDTDPPSTTLLAILALDLRHPEEQHTGGGRPSTFLGFAPSHPPAGRIHAGMKEWKIV